MHTVLKFPRRQMLVDKFEKNAAVVSVQTSGPGKTGSLVGTFDPATSLVWQLVFFIYWNAVSKLCIPKYIRFYEKVKVDHLTITFSSFNKHHVFLALSLSLSFARQSKHLQANEVTYTFRDTDNCICAFLFRRNLTTVMHRTQNDGHRYSFMYELFIKSKLLTSWTKQEWHLCLNAIQPFISPFWVFFFSWKSLNVLAAYWSWQALSGSGVNIQSLPNIHFPVSFTKFRGLNWEEHQATECNSIHICCVRNSGRIIIMFTCSHL